MADLYTKILLTVIAVAVASIALRMGAPVKVDPPISGIPVHVMR